MRKSNSIRARAHPKFCAFIVGQPFQAAGSPDFRVRCFLVWDTALEGALNRQSGNAALRKLSALPAILLSLIIVLAGSTDRLRAQASQTSAPPSAPEIRTPKAPPTPRVNGPSVFGVRPGNPFIYQIPATGDRPMEFSVRDLPKGLQVDVRTGRITGSIAEPGEHTVTLQAKNAKGSGEKKFKIVAGEEIALTPPLGWNSWNCWGVMVDAEKVRRSARAMVESGLINHGWAYINIDDAWQAAQRGGPFNAIQGNEKFPDMKDLCDEVHSLGLKIGIYSTPWETSYAGFIGGSADNPEGAWSTNLIFAADGRARKRYHGGHPFAENDARQWAAWGIDYLKYDWNPKSSTPRETLEEFENYVATMARALRKSGRDIPYSYSNSMPIEWVKDVSKYFNAWRTTGDVHDTWWSITGIGFSQDRWTQFSGPGHWNDPDMLVVGYVDVGRGRNLHPSRLTPDEQYTHITLWSLLAAPLLIGCDMERLDSFTLNLLSNDEVLAVDQDPLGKQATLVSEYGPKVTLVNVRSGGRPNQERTLSSFQIWARPLEDGSHAVGLFNLGDTNAAVTVKWSDLKFSGSKTVRDIWRQKDLGKFNDEFSVTVAPHGAEMVKIN
jgi:alpha-galactosidase